MSGGGVLGGVTHGESGELGYKTVVDRVHVNDIHAAHHTGDPSRYADGVALRNEKFLHHSLDTQYSSTLFAFENSQHSLQASDEKRRIKFARGLSGEVASL